MTEKKITLIIISVFLVITIVATTVAIGFRFLSKKSNVNSSIPIIETESSSEVSNNDLISSGISQTEKDEIVYESDDGTNFSVPDTLRAVYLKPGVDFLLKSNDSVDKIKSQIDSAMKSTAKLGFNSIVLFTETAQGVLFSDPYLKSARNDIDIVEYTISSAKEHNLYSYIVYPILLQKDTNGNKEIASFSKEIHSQIKERAKDFSVKYKPSAIVFDSYTVSKSKTMQQGYELENIDKPIEEYLRNEVTIAVREARNEIRKNNNVSQVGFIASGVWANQSTDAKGSKTSSDFESYVDGFADTRSFVLNEKFNFVMVENTMPTDSVKNNFTVIANWWSSLCSQTNTVFYNVHASSKLMTSLGEFSSPDQLILQASVLKPLKSFGGNVFDSLSALTADKDGSTTLLLKYFDNQLTDSLIFNKLIMSSPSKNTITTYDSKITFSGVTDPNFKTLFNDELVAIGEKGYFSFEVDLKIGVNTFKISHKGKSVKYTITRKVEIIESIMPTGVIEVDGGTTVALSVKAYKGSQVVAKIGTKSIDLIECKTQETSEENSNFSYADFEAVYTVPEATYSVQNLGEITFSAAWQGYNETKKGATIKILAKPQPPKSESQMAVQIKADYAETFPTNILNDKSQPYCYPLPKGTIDYIVGNEISYSDSTGSFKYYKLQSGQRVYSKDLVVLGEKEKVNNKISSVNLKYDDRFLNLEISNSWNVPYVYIESPISYYTSGDYAGVALSSDYKISKITYRIFYTDEIGLSKVTMDANPIVKSVECILKKVNIDGVEIPVCDIELTLKTAGGFFGATPSYDNSTLKIRLNTPAPIQKGDNSYGYTLKGAKIIIDAGHGGGDPGATGVIPSFQEYILNEQIRQKVVAILKNLGAEVVAVDNSVYKTAEKRFEYYQASDSHLMISIHQDSGSSSARGASGFYFNSYSQLLAKNIMDSVAGNYISSGSNRSERYSFNRLKMTRQPYYPSMLIECGFISNPEQHADLINSENQQKIAEQIVKGMIKYFVSTGSLNYADLVSSSQSEIEASSSSQTESDKKHEDDSNSSDIPVIETSSNTLAYIHKKIDIA